MVDSVSVRFRNARVGKMPLNIRVQWNAGAACVSECVLKTQACRDVRVSPSKLVICLLTGSHVSTQRGAGFLAILLSQRGNR